MTLVIKLGVAAAFASLVVQFDVFKRALFSSSAARRDRMALLSAFGISLAVLALCRRFLGYSALDIGLEGCFAVGVACGFGVGIGSALLASLPLVAVGEVLSLPVYVFAAFLGAGVTAVFSVKEGRFDFSPFSLLQLRSILREAGRAGGMTWRLSVLLLCLTLEGGRLLFVLRYGTALLFGLYGSHAVTDIFVLFTFIGTVGVILKIWNNTMVEIKLTESSRGLLEARFQALQAKLKPHFLFNTLNTISSLIRSDPDDARRVIHSLSSLLRFHLESKGDFCRLKDEMELVRRYMEIEQARFGGDFLRFELVLPEELRDLKVPSMILQPLVENCVKHGIGPKVGGGTVRVRAGRDGSYLVLEVEDDGVGIEPSRMGDVKSSGVGISNLVQRLGVLYGEGGYLFDIKSGVSGGTYIRIGIPMEGVE